MWSIITLSTPHLIWVLTIIQNGFFCISKYFCLYQRFPLFLSQNILRKYVQSCKISIYIQIVGLSDINDFHLPTPNSKVFWHYAPTLFILILKMSLFLIIVAKFDCWTNKNQVFDQQWKVQMKMYFNDLSVLNTFIEKSMQHLFFF